MLENYLKWVKSSFIGLLEVEIDGKHLRGKQLCEITAKLSS